MDRLLPWLRRSGWAYALLAVALAGLAWKVAGAGSDPTQPERVAATAAVTVAPAPAGVLVHVTGAVRRPGIYRVPADARVNRAIRVAGGARAGADLSGINLAAPVQDGQQVRVPARVQARSGAAAGAGAPQVGEAPPAGPISLSGASAAQLDGLDGIGPTLAARIVAWRDAHGGFASVDQLMEVPGIGPAKLDAIREQVTP